MGALFTYIKDRKLPILCAFFHWFFLQVMQVDRNFFLYSEANRVMIVSKILAFFLLVFIWNTIFSLYRDRKKGNAFAKRFIDLFGIYFLFLCLLLLLLWPGTWSWDDLWVLCNTQHYRIMAWQHVLSGYEQIVFLQLFPSMGGYVLVKNFLIAGIVAYVICKIEIVFRLRKAFDSYWLDSLVKLLPFMLPPVLMYQFSGYRIGLYIYLELLMFIIMICSMKGAYQWNGFKIFLFSLLIAVCAVWRSESFLYVVLGVCFYAASKNATFSKKMRIAAAISLLLFFAGLTHWQSNALRSNNYQIMSTIRPAVELIRQADSIKDAVELEKMDKVLKVDVVRAHPEQNGEAIYWGFGGVREKYTKQAYHDYLQSVVKLTLRYPAVVWNERIQLFYATSGFNKRHQYANVDTSIAAFISGTHNNKPLSEIVTEQKYPLLKNLRTKVIHCMGLVKKGAAVQPLYSIVWNIIVPMVVLVIGFFMLLKQKKWQLSFLLAIVLFKIPIVWLTAPAQWFMYYLSFYFLGYVLFHFYVLHWLQSRKEKAL